LGGLSEPKGSKLVISLDAIARSVTLGELSLRYGTTRLSGLPKPTGAKTVSCRLVSRKKTPPPELPLANIVSN